MINNNSTFKEDDVTLLFTDITGKIEPLATKEREVLIQSGVHYSEMLPLESKPSKHYIKQYYNALYNFSLETAKAVANVSEKIFFLKGKNVVLVSLARAGTPIGILIKRYLMQKYNLDVMHYSISIIRGRGIDKNAMKYILQKHDAKDIQFVDGWTGKGAILNELSEAINEFISHYDKSTLLAVLSDPANITDVYGTHDDIPIASSFLNSTVCGLMSRTILHRSLQPTDFHGIVFHTAFKDEDRTYEFIDKISSYFYKIKKTGIDEVTEIAKKFDIQNINFIKPGIGETTRVLLRRLPDIILVSENASEKLISHILVLAKEKNVPIVRYPLENYQVCGIIKDISSDL